MKFIDAAATAAAGAATPAKQVGARRWRIAAYAGTAILATGVSACVIGIPLSLTDFTGYLIDSEPLSLWQLWVERLQTSYSFRPMLWVQMKAVFEHSGGAYFPAFKAYHVAHVVLTMLLCARVLRVRSAAGCVAALIVMTVILGSHTAINTLREGPMTMPLSMALALNLAAGERQAWWRDACAIALLAFAALSVELGLLLWVVYLAARLLGWQGVSWAGIAAASVVVVAYLGYRGLVLNPGAEGVEFRATGIGLMLREPDQLHEMFAGRMVLLYAHNVVVSVLTVLFSEPREGVWYVVRAAIDRDLKPWLWINLVSSTLGTICLAWYVRCRLSSWVRRQFTDGDRLVLVGLCVLAANALISFGYSRDVIMQPAGMMYALALFPALVAAFEQMGCARVVFRAVAVVGLTVLSATWTARTVGTMHVLRETAFDKRNQWAEAVDLLRSRGGMPADHRKEIVFALRRHALQMSTPNPGLAQPWAEAWTDRLY